MYIIIDRHERHLAELAGNEWEYSGLYLNLIAILNLVSWMGLFPFLRLIPFFRIYLALLEASVKAMAAFFCMIFLSVGAFFTTWFLKNYDDQSKTAYDRAFVELVRVVEIALGDWGNWLSLFDVEAPDPIIMFNKYLSKYRSLDTDDATVTEFLAENTTYPTNKMDRALFLFMALWMMLLLLNLLIAIFSEAFGEIKDNEEGNNLRMVNSFVLDIETLWCFCNRSKNHKSHLIFAEYDVTEANVWQGSVKQTTKNVESKMDNLEKRLLEKSESSNVLLQYKIKEMLKEMKDDVKQTIHQELTDIKHKLN